MGRKPFSLLNGVEGSMKQVIIWIELILAGFIMITVVLSAKDIVVLIYRIMISEADTSYTVLQGLLSHILLLVVGLELSLMLISHTPGNVLEVILYAIARNMLISSTSSIDFLLGVISITIIFAVDKYLHTRDIKRTIT